MKEERAELVQEQKKFYAEISFEQGKFLHT